MARVERKIGGYHHTQEDEETTWNIEHMLNTDSPVVDCWIMHESELRRFMPLSVNVLDANSVSLTFSSPMAGEAIVL
jgi:hypothetical protein